MLIILILVAVAIIFLLVRPYFRRYDTVVAYTGGLGTGKSFLSTETAEVLLRKARSRTRLYNFFHPRSKQPMPQIYSSIPLKIKTGLFRREYSLRLEPGHLTLQYNIVPGSVVFLDEIDVFANQFGLTNQNIIDTSTKRDLTERRENPDVKFPDTGLVDEEIRLFRHLFTNPFTGVEPKFVCNSQATSNIITVIRRRMNTVYVLSTFRTWGIPILSTLAPRLFPKFLYTVKCRNITITDEITNTSDENTEDNMRLIIGFLPIFYRRYDSHCYRGRSETIPFQQERRWTRLKTERLLKCPVDKLYNQSKTED